MGLKATLLGEVNQEVEGLVVNSVLGVVEEDPASLRVQALTACGISGKEFLEGGFCYFVAVVDEGLPGWELGWVRHGD